MPNVNNKEAAVIAIEVITTNRKTTTLLIIPILIMIVIVLIVHQPVVKTLVQKVMSNLRQVIIVIPPVRSLVYPDKSSPKGDRAPSLSHSNNSDMTRHDEDLLSQENCIGGASENHFHDFRGVGGDCEEVVLSLPPSSTKHKSEKHPQNSKKSRQNNNKKNKNKKSVSKHQKLLRKRYEKTRENDFTKKAAANAGTGNNDEDEDDSSSRQDVKCNYSIVYFNWAVSDSEDSDDDDDEESEDGPVTNVTIPLFKNLKISS